MSESSYEIIRGEIISEIKGHDVTSDDYLTSIKALEAINKAEAALKTPEPPEPKGAKAWFEKHSDALIKVGGTLSTVALIGFVESKFDVIFRSKASKYL